EFDGVKLAEYVAKSRSPFPVIALSSCMNSGDLGPHFAAVLHKPYTEEQLVNTIATVLSEARPLPRSPSTIYPIRVEEPESTSPRKRNIRILVVEDDSFNSRVMVRMLNALGYYDVETAENGSRAVKMVCRNRGSGLPEKKDKKSSYDLIFMDIIMPVMDGVKATQRICSMFERPELRPRICAVSGYISDEDRRHYAEVGMDDFLVKPLESKDRLAEVINRLFPA